MLSMMFSPGFYGVVAEREGRIVGSNCLDERSIISGVGPITIEPAAKSGIGRKLMQAVMDRANEQGAAGIRLVQAAFHNRSLSLYAGLGFESARRFLHAGANPAAVARMHGAGRRNPPTLSLRHPVPAGPWIRSHGRVGRSHPAGNTQAW